MIPCTTVIQVYSEDKTQLQTATLINLEIPVPAVYKSFQELVAALSAGQVNTNLTRTRH